MLEDLMKYTLYAILLSATHFTVLADDAVSRKAISYDMAFLQTEPQLVKRDGKFLGWLNSREFIWLDTSSGKSIYFKIDAKSKNKTQIELDHLPQGFQKPCSHRSDDLKARVWVSEGDVFYADSNGTRQLTFSRGIEANPRISPNGQAIAYTRDGNLYVYDRLQSVEKQLTSDSSDTIQNGYASWVYYEEIYGRGMRYRAFWWSPDSKQIAFMRFDDSAVDLFQIYHIGGVNGYWEETRYPKAGQVNPSVKLGVVHLDNLQTTWMEPQADNTSYLAWPFWRADSQSLWVQWMNRDQNELILYRCDAATGKAVKTYEEQQESWVEFLTDLTFLKDGSFLIRSNKSGYAHLYRYSETGQLMVALTAGDWRVRKILAVDAPQGLVYFTGNYSDSINTDLMVVSLDGKNLKCLTSEPGTHQITLSPQFKYGFDWFSDFQSPPQAWVYSLEKAKYNWKLSDSSNPESHAYQLGQFEYFTIPTDDGYELPAYWILPPDFDSSGKTRYPVIFRIYSGPDTPTVMNRYNMRAGWRDHYYAAKGVITISVDHRASGHFGKKGVALAHRKLSHWELNDLIQAVKWLRSKPFVDPQRMGIVGYSYGGYMALLAMTAGADYFTHGISGAPVTDWKFYDSVYTERYMDTPRQNEDGYRQASILYHADKLKGPLRIFHGATDDNVHFQQTLELVDKWTNLAKPFELMVYPESRHGVKQRGHMDKSEHDFWVRHFRLNDKRP
ncbi:MAG: hypothetical protein CSA81_12795 [Acidobacteria bacterium]|nr:MAG: hypothetical protein CSA81_12795 [Acidobacteriota bacterium]